MRLPRNILFQPNGYIHENGSLNFLTAAKQTVGNAGVLTAAQIRAGLLTQDASGGSVTMATPTAASLQTMFPDWNVGEGIFLCMYGNHATNTITLNGGTGVTVVGGNTATTTGGIFILTKTAGGA